MATSLNRGVPARDAGYQMVQYIGGRIQAAAGGGAVNVKLGTLPAGSIMLAAYSKVATAITGGTPVLALGTASGGTQIQGTMAEAAGFEVVLPAGTLAGPLTADTDVWAGISGGATAGDAYIVVLFAKPIA